MHPAIIIYSSVIVDLAMGQIPLSTERITSFFYIKIVVVVVVVILVVVIFYTVAIK